MQSEWDYLILDQISNLEEKFKLLHFPVFDTVYTGGRASVWFALKYDGYTIYLINYWPPLWVSSKKRRESSPIKYCFINSAARKLGNFWPNNLSRISFYEKASPGKISRKIEGLFKKCQRNFSYLEEIFFGKNLALIGDAIDTTVWLNSACFWLKKLPILTYI